MDRTGAFFGLLQLDLVGDYDTGACPSVLSARQVPNDLFSFTADSAPGGAYGLRPPHQLVGLKMTEMARTAPTRCERKFPGKNRRRRILTWQLLQQL